MCNEWLSSSSYSPLACVHMPPHLKDKNQEDTFFWGEGGVCTKATCPCEQRAYCLIERKGETDGCNTVPTFFGNGMNFYRGDCHE